MNESIDWHSDFAHEFDAKYQSRPSFKERFAVWQSLIQRYGGPTCQVLDLGCGSGVFSLCAARSCGAVTGVDGSAEMLRLCEKKMSASGCTNVTFLRRDIENLELDQKFDLILASSVFEYIVDLETLLSHVASLLTPEGILVCSLPNSQSVYRKFERMLFRATGRPGYYRHVKGLYDKRVTPSVLRRAGLQEIESQYYASTPMLSPILRFLGLPQYADNLFVVVCRTV